MGRTYAARASDSGSDNICAVCGGRSSGGEDVAVQSEFCGESTVSLLDDSVS